MQRIKELPVVEGKHDAARLQALYDCDVVCTGGLAMMENTLEMVKTAAKKQGVIILTDSDHPGETIRRQLLEMVPEAQVAVVPKEDSIGKRNVGVEYASDEAIRKALEERITLVNDRRSLTWEEYCQLDIAGSRSRREKVCGHFRVGLCNNKTLFKRLNMLGVTAEQVQEVLNG